MYESGPTIPRISMKAFPVYDTSTKTQAEVFVSLSLVQRGKPDNIVTRHGFERAAPG